MQTGAENFIPLEAMQVASPCDRDWNAMRGDDSARFCQSCAKHVYNLSGMTRAEAENLIRSHERDMAEGEFCIRLSRRADGTIITDNCPIGLRRFRNAARYSGRIVLFPLHWAVTTALLVASPFLIWGGSVLVFPYYVKALRYITGQRVQTVFGISNNALSTGDMLNIPTIDMLSIRENKPEQPLPRESVPPERASPPAVP